MPPPEVLPFSTLSEQLVELAKVRALADDDEEAHVAEKMLWRYTLLAIGSGILKGSSAKTAARVALETEEIEFCRWYA